MIFDHQEVVLATNRSMAADFNSASLEVWPFLGGALQMVWTGANAFSPTLTPQGSVDGANWCDLISVASSKKVDAASGCQLYEFTNFGYKHLRLKFIANTNTAGTITVTCFAKRERTR